MVKKRTIPCGTNAGNPERAVKMGPSFPLGQSITTQDSLDLVARGFSHIFTTLRLRGRPGRDGCQSALLDCFGDTFSTWRQIRPPKQPHNTLWQPSGPGQSGQ